MGGLAAVGLGGFASAGRAAGVLEGPAFGSSWRLVCGPDLPGTLRSDIARRIAALIEGIDAEMSPYRAGSALSRFNAGPAAQWLDLPPALCTVAAAALTMARQSEGAFDPTVGPAVRAFGFGPIRGVPGSPSLIDVRDGAARKGAPGLTLDLCGIAKGYALDRVCADLVARGLTDFLLEIGGEVRAVGRHPSGRAWRVAIEDPFEMTPASAMAPDRVAAGLARRPGVAAVVTPGALALATSGHRVNGVSVGFGGLGGHGPSGAITLGHVIDPGTARPAARFAGSVSVLAPTGMAADAWATALFALGPNGVALARRHRIAALFILDRPGAAGRVCTGGFDAHIHS